MIKVIIPIEGDRMSEHFGRAPKFAVYEIDNGKIISVEIEPAPEHYEGSYPQWIISKNADVVIVAGMGPKAIELLESKGVRVITNVVPKNARQIVEDFINNKLDVSYQEVCEHEHNH